MQPTESLSVSRRALDVEDYIDILRRHKGWIFGPFLLTLVGAVVGVHLWPDSYESSATVEVKPQQVSEKLVPTMVVQSMTDRINQMANTILSRTALTTIIRNFDLYKREQTKMPVEDVIEQMRKAIRIAPIANFAGQGREVPAFTVSFSYSNRDDAQRVVGELVSRFMDENVRQRGGASYQAEQYFQDQTNKAKAELDEVENRLTQFRMANAGRLPDQVDSNLQRLNGLNSQVSVVMNGISRTTNEKFSLEAQIRLLRDNLEALGREGQVAAAMAPPKSAALAEVDRNVDVLERQLTDARRMLKENHPDVRTLVGRLENERSRRERILADEAATRALVDETMKSSVPAVNPQLARERRNFENTIQMNETQVQNKNRELEDLNRQLKSLNEQITSAQARIQAAPVGQQEYMALLRDQTLARDRWIEASTNLDRARASKDVEDRKQGETLSVLDPASRPTSPTSPKRGMVISIGAALGLLLGVVVAGAREVKDTSLKNLKDVRAYTQMAILGSVPLLENDFVVRRRKRIAWLGWTTACLLAVIVMAGSIVYYYATTV